MDYSRPMQKEKAPCPKRGKHRLDKGSDQEACRCNLRSSQSLLRYRISATFLHLGEYYHNNSPVLVTKTRHICYTLKGGLTVRLQSLPKVCFDY